MVRCDILAALRLLWHSGRASVLPSNDKPESRFLLNARDLIIRKAHIESQQQTLIAVKIDTIANEFLQLRSARAISQGNLLIDSSRGASYYRTAWTPAQLLQIGGSFIELNGAERLTLFTTSASPWESDSPEVNQLLTRLVKDSQRKSPRLQIRLLPIGERWYAVEVWDGAPERIRTSDLLLRRQTLYPAELRARTSQFYLNASRRVVS